MKFKETSHTLKSGKQITIRLPQMEDAQNLNALKRHYVRNTTTLPLTIDDYPEDIEKEQKTIETYNNSTNSILLVAEHEGTLIGNIDITGSLRSKMAHTGMLGMGILEAWRNQGLGKALIQEAVSWSRDNSPLEVIWLNVYSSNGLGLNLYKNTGFELSGTIKRFFKEEHGYIDKMQMAKQIK